MLIVCQHCQRQLNLLDEKVPPGPFALTCPSCQNRIEIDPTEPQAIAPDGSVAAAQPSPTGQMAFEPLPPMRELGRELVARLNPLAAVIDLTGSAADHVEAGLKLLGMKEVQHFDDFEQAGEDLLENDFAILVVVIERATAPPCEPLVPLYRLPLNVRRGIFVALMAPNVRTLDGQTAFYLQVNCLLSSTEMAKFPANLQRALVFHLRHYRFWGIQED